MPSRKEPSAEARAALMVADRATKLAQAAFGLAAGALTLAGTLAFICL